MRIGPFSLHVTGLNLLLWALGICFLLQFAFSRIQGTPGGGGLFGGLDGLAIWAAGSDGPRAVFWRGEWWRLYSSVFLHGHLLHFLMNAFALYQLGRIAEYIYGSTRLLLTFLVTGLIASLTSDAWFALKGSPGLSVGASGAVCGLLGLLLAHMRQRRDAAAQFYGRQLLQWAVINLVFGLVYPRINNAAHLGGFAAGYLLAQVLSTSHFLHLTKRRRETLLRASTAFLGLASLVALGIAGSGASERLRFIEATVALHQRILNAESYLQTAEDRVRLGDAVLALHESDAPGELAEIRGKALELLRDSPVPSAVILARLDELATRLWELGHRRAPDIFPSLM